MINSGTFWVRSSGRVGSVLRKMRVFSGIQPTGRAHLGNYLGAIKHWRALQHQRSGSSKDLLYCIVDLHALSANIRPEPSVLRTQSLDMAAMLLATGIDPNHSTLFLQSSVSLHCELMWVLGNLVPLGRLSLMTGFKAKARTGFSDAKWGLFTYPILMAADVLLYRSLVTLKKVC